MFQNLSAAEGTAIVLALAGILGAIANFFKPAIERRTASETVKANSQSETAKVAVEIAKLMEQGRRQELDDIFTRLTAEVLRLTSEVEELRDRVTEAERITDAATKRAEVAEKEAATARAALADAQIKITEQESTIRAMQEEIDTLRRRVQELENTPAQIMIYPEDT